MKSKFVQYYVEGEDEKKIINVLKSDLKVIRPGKVQKLNVTTQKITDMRLRALALGTMVVFAFDTDRGEVDMLKENIEIVKACPSVSEIILIPQVPNIEGELVRSCNIKNLYS